VNLLEVIVAFRKSRYFRWFYLVIISLMVAALLPYLPYLGPLVCLGIFLIPVLMFAMPWWLGDRKMKVLAVNGVVILVLSAFILAALDAQSAVSTTPGVLGSPAAPLSVANGTVSPPRGPPTAFYNFTVTMKDTSNRDPGSFTVYLNLTWLVGIDAIGQSYRMGAVDVGDNVTLDGKSYFVNRSLEDHIYYFWFSVQAPNGTWIESTYTLGPMVTGYGSFFGISLYVGFLNMLIPVSFFYILLLLYWYTQRAKRERKRLGLTAARAEAVTDTGFMCTNCGADVPETAEKCPKCGAVFEEEPAKEASKPSEESAEERPADEEPDAKP